MLGVVAKSERAIAKRIATALRIKIQQGLVLRIYFNTTQRL
jgi:hypothetical protein